MAPPDDRCGFCGETAIGLVRGRTAAICPGCLARAVAALVGPRPARALELPEADDCCAFCHRPTPASARFEGLAPQASICSSCVGRSFAFLADTAGLDERRATWQGLFERLVQDMLRGHFGGVELDRIVTGSRTFPVYHRVDVDRTLAAAYEGMRCLGLVEQHGHATLTVATLTQPHGNVSVAPLRYDEVDVGGARPARCVETALWLSDDGPHAVLLTPDQHFGRTSGVHVEVAVPAGEAGAAVVRRVFERLEEAVKQSATYRGKVLSLESIPHAAGTVGDVVVHRLPPVARQDVILPASTLALLERNVFTFAAQRPALAAMGLPVKKGLLFYGPPGTGKTHTIRYLAGALPDHTTLLVTAEQVGLLAEYMTLARLLAPAIVVIEDADLVGRQRERMGSVCEEVLLNQLLNEMDGLKENAEVFFVLTTNRPEALEAALTARPGRIDQAIEFPLPDADGRSRLARLYGSGARLADDTLGHVVERTAGVSAAFIKELMRRSAQFALERGGELAIGRSDVDAAVEELLVTGGRLNAALLGALGART